MFRIEYAGKSEAAFIVHQLLLPEVEFCGVIRTNLTALGPLLHWVLYELPESSLIAGRAGAFIPESAEFTTTLKEKPWSIPSIGCVASVISATD